MEHPNVFKDYYRGNGAFAYYICLDILHERNYSGTIGWTPAYSVMVCLALCIFVYLFKQSILMQLQTFLFDENNVAKSGRFKTFRGI